MLTEKTCRNIIKTTAVLELLIGLIVLLGSIVPVLFSFPAHLPSVYVFVAVSSLISIVIGAGLSSYRLWARKVLVFFAGYIIITKVMIFAGLADFTGNTISFIPVWIKDLISVLYHAVILLAFNRKDVMRLLK